MGSCFDIIKCRFAFFFRYFLKILWNESFFFPLWICTRVLQSQNLPYMTFWLTFLGGLCLLYSSPPHLGIHLKFSLYPIFIMAKYFSYMPVILLPPHLANLFGRVMPVVLLSPHLGVHLKIDDISTFFGGLCLLYSSPPHTLLTFLGGLCLLYSSPPHLANLFGRVMPVVLLPPTPWRPSAVYLFWRVMPVVLLPPHLGVHLQFTFFGGLCLLYSSPHTLASICSLPFLEGYACCTPPPTPWRPSAVYLFWRVMPVVLLPPHLGVHLQFDILKVYISAHVFYVFLGHVVTRMIPVCWMAKRRQLFPVKKRYTIR